MKDEELLRYSRHIMLPQVDVAGQEKLLAARVLIAGLGGLGCPAALYLAAAGVGELHIADRDKVELSNLQRQILFGDEDLAKSKVDAGAARLEGLRTGARVIRHECSLDDESLPGLLHQVDFVVDGTDNFNARYAINRACVSQGRPLVSGAAIRFEAQISLFDPRVESSPCYACLYPRGDDEALNCAENGVAAPLVGMVGSLMALEAMKLITGAGEPLIGKVLHVDALSGEFRRFSLKRRDDCRVCGVREFGRKE